MTRDEWLACEDPRRMLDFVRTDPRFGYGPEGSAPGACITRKLRLWACALCRHPAVWPRLTDPRSRQAVEVAELYADGLATEGELSVGIHRADMTEGWANRATHWVAPLPGSPTRTVVWALTGLMYFLKDAVRPADAASLLRDVAGDPWRPVMLPGKRPKCQKCGSERYAPVPISTRNDTMACKGCHGRWEWPADAYSCPWLTPTAVSLAQAAYEQRWIWCPCFYAGQSDERCQRCHGFAGKGFLDPAALLVLSDAMEEAGCSDGALLGHLRGPGPHVRGCWVLDLLLGKS
jgi:hypothetical protein